MLIFGAVGVGAVIGRRQNHAAALAIALGQIEQMHNGLVEHVRDELHHVDARHNLAALPTRHRLPRHVQLRRKPFLRQALAFAQLNQFCCEIHRKLLSRFCWQNSIPTKREFLATFSCESNRHEAPTPFQPLCTEEFKKLLDVRRSSRSELGCRLVAICVTWAFLIPKRLLRNALRQSLRTSGIFLHWQRIGRGGGSAAGARRTMRSGGGLSGRGGASLGSSGCGAVPSHCRGGATSCASEGTGRMVRGGGPARRMMRAAALRAAARLRRWRD